MPTIIPNFAPNEKISADKVNDVNELIEKHLNGNLRKEDFQGETTQYTSSGFNIVTTDKVIESRHIHPPKFYGSPSPRAEFASSDIVYRQVDHTTRNSFMMWSGCSTNWEPVPGLSMTIHVKPLYDRLAHVRPDKINIYANVLANWTVREITDDVATTHSVRPHAKRIAEYALFNNLICT